MFQRASVNFHTRTFFIKTVVMYFFTLQHKYSRADYKAKYKQTSERRSHAESLRLIYCSSVLVRFNQIYFDT